MIKFLNKKDGFEKINYLGSKKEPFLFIISFDKNQIYANSLKKLDKNIKYNFGNSYKNSKKKINLKKYPINFEIYKQSFNRVIEEIKKGNTYLLNLTFENRIEINLSLEEIFHNAKAPYKLLIQDYFLCFSPEKFIEIKNDTISTYPMKGTIDASIPSAKEKILKNQKELAEHIMIVDLLRNDLNLIASNTKVEKFRYIDKIEAGDKELLQVSSKISAKLDKNWYKNIGDILSKITPAGSITGTPKKKTLEIIKSVENRNRAFYTGVFGIFDGKNLKSAIMIRSITQKNGNIFYNSGGGITIDSNLIQEYNELIDKIYIPF